MFFKYGIVFFVLCILMPLACSPQTPQTPQAPIIIEDFPLVRFMRDGLYGYKKNDGTVVIEARYKDCDYTFSEGLAFFKGRSALWGIINRKGALYSDAVYSRPGRFHDGLAVVQKKDQFFIINRQLQELCVDIVRQLKKISWPHQSIFSRKGVVAGQLVKRVNFNNFHGGRCSFSVDVNAKERLIGFINSKGKLVLPPAKRSLRYSEGYSLVKRDGAFCFVDKAGREKLGPFVRASLFSDGLAAVCLSAKTNQSNIAIKSPRYYDTKYGFIDKKGKLVIAARFDEVRPFRDGLAAVMVGSRTVVVKQGWKVPFQGRWGFINRAGKIVVPARFSAVTDFDNGRARVLIGGRYKIISSFQESGFVFSQKVVDGKWAVIDRQGVVSPSL